MDYWSPWKLALEFYFVFDKNKMKKLFCNSKTNVWVNLFKISWDAPVGYLLWEIMFAQNMQRFQRIYVVMALPQLVWFAQSMDNGDHW